MIKLSEVKPNDILFYNGDLVSVVRVLRDIFQEKEIALIELIIQDDEWDKNVSNALSSLWDELEQGEVSESYPLKNLNTIEVEIDITKDDIEEIDEVACKYVLK